MLQFTQVSIQNTLGLYAVQNSNPATGIQLYFLLLGSPSSDLPETLTLMDSWRQYDGVYLFIPDSQKPPSNDLFLLARALGLVPAFENSRAFAWIPHADMPHFEASVILAAKGQYDSAIVRRPAPISFGNVDLNIPAGTAIAPNFDELRFDFQSQRSPVVLERNGVSPGSLSPDQGLVSLSFDISQMTLGALGYQAVRWQFHAFFTLFRDDIYSPMAVWGGEIRYFYRSHNRFEQLVYPLFTPSNDAYNFSVLMHPLFPTDGTRTMFTFSPDNTPPTLRSTFGRTTTGTVATLVPQAGVGFYLATRPNIINSEVQGTEYVYLAPIGHYQVAFGDESRPQKLMCGLSGLEYLRIYSGDFLEFMPSRPAFAPNFLSPAQLQMNQSGRPQGLTPTIDESGAVFPSESGLALTSAYTTSWVRCIPNRSIAIGDRTRGYFAQPNTSVNYARGALSKPMNYSAAVSSLVAPFGDGSSSPTSASDISFPMVFYGGIYPPSDSVFADSWPNQGVAGATFSQFEKHILITTRHQTLQGENPPSPIFQNESGNALTGRSVTPQGLLVQLNGGTSSSLLAQRFNLAEAPSAPQGSWQQLILAKNNDQALSIEADPKTGSVDGHLAYALMGSQVFLVLNNWDVFQNIQSQISVDNFNFDIRPPSEAKDPRQTLLVFKYTNTRSLTELIHKPEVWADTDYMIGKDPNLVLDAQQTLIEMLSVAEKTKGNANDPFVYFRDVVASSETWTGFLAVNARVSGSPAPDVEMLIAGINGDLLAHHFGVEVNHIQSAPSPTSGEASQPDIQRSSLFGVINYQDTTPPFDLNQTAPDYAYSIRQLIAVLQNSTLTQFHTTVGMVINKLFGRAVSLQPSSPTAPGADVSLCDVPNMLCISGRYQKDGDIGKLVFGGSDTQHQFFSINADNGYIRILDKFLVTGATLSPSNTTGKNSALLSANAQPASVLARFSLSGELLFRASPFPIPDIKLDLFSYGVEENGQFSGLPLQGLAFDILINLDATGKRQGPINITPFFSNIIATEKKQAIRDTGLLKKLPMKLQDFLQDEKGLASSTPGISSMHLPQLMKLSGDATSNANYTTSQPTFALRFNLPLGSLGSLSELHAGINASLLLAWGPSEAASDNDGAAMLVQLPQLGAGYSGFNLQGLIKTTFGDANLAEVMVNDTPVYAILFNNIALSIFGIQLPPGVIIDFVLFTNPSAADGTIAWNLAATQMSSNGDSPCK